MQYQPESDLEEKLLQQLASMSYERTNITTEEQLLKNLKIQLEKLNNDTYSDKEFEKILAYLDTGGIIDRAKRLRADNEMKLDRPTGFVYVKFLNQKDFCQNIFQVTNQVVVNGVRKRRYDVTILINGLPLVQIELKRPGVQMSEAFNQIAKYRNELHTTKHKLFMYIQLFVISNGVNTKYFANNKELNRKQTFFWAREDNERISNLKDFADSFLQPCHITKMIGKYSIITTSNEIRVMRPYQYYAVEAIVEKIKNGVGNAYIWHTTGSGKTLTSFKASMIIKSLSDGQKPLIKKTIFVVDRKDLDYQTAKEFNSFVDGSVDMTTNTKKLVDQLKSNDTNFIVTTIQKLNTAITKQHHQDLIDHLRDERVVFVFDECHRSQFGATHKNIEKFFRNAQMIGFTGTPIFKENANQKNKERSTTAALFGELLHKYLISDAISDGNVLSFVVEYVGEYEEKANQDDEKKLIRRNSDEVMGIDIDEVLNSDVRLGKVVDYIIEQHPRKTKNKVFNSIFCVSGIPALIKYYEIFQTKKEAGEHDLRVATIFSYSENEDNQNIDNFEEEPAFDFFDRNIDMNTRDKLDTFMSHYNQMFGTNFNTTDKDSFYRYYQDLANRGRDGQYDILLVVNMFLTGYDNPKLNTLYVDKKLKMHGLVQAFSRTNRILNEMKSHGNIVCFRNLKTNADSAFKLFANRDAEDFVINKPYSEYVEKFNEVLSQMRELTPTESSVDKLQDEEEVLAFVTMFRSLLSIYNIMSTYSAFEQDDINIDVQEFENFKSKYLDIWDDVKTSANNDKASVLDDIDFNLDLMHRDEINVYYILRLLKWVGTKTEEEETAAKTVFMAKIRSEPALRSKKELLEQFISDENWDKIDHENPEESFESFQDDKRDLHLAEMAESIDVEKADLEKVISNATFDQRLPRSKEIMDILRFQPGTLKRKSIYDSALRKIEEFLEIFEK